MDRSRRFGVDTREAFKIAFRVARRCSTHSSNRASRPGSAGALAHRTVYPKVVRVLLRPFETAFFTVDAQAQYVFIARGHLTAPEHPSRALAKPQQHMRIAVQVYLYPN